MTYSDSKIQSLRTARAEREEFAANMLKTLNSIYQPDSGIFKDAVRALGTLSFLSLRQLELIITNRSTE